MYASLPLTRPTSVSAVLSAKLGDPEIDQLDRPVVGPEHVLRADVAVDDAERRAVEVGQVVGVGQAGECVDDDLEHELVRQRPPDLARPIHHLAQRLTIEVLHCQPRLALLVADLEGLHDVGVAEPRGQARLVEQQRAVCRCLGLCEQVAAQPLDDDELVEPGHAAAHGEEHLRHAAASERGDQPIVTDDDGLHGAPVARFGRGCRTAAARNGLRRRYRRSRPPR
jgi:hypothetical protein